MSDAVSEDIRILDHSSVLGATPEEQVAVILWLKSVAALREECSAQLACAAHDCPVPCEACSAEGEFEVVCSACKHVFAAVPVVVENRACASESEFIRTRHIAFYSEARALLLRSAGSKDGREGSKPRQRGHDIHKDAARRAVQALVRGLLRSKLGLPENVGVDRKREVERRTLESLRKRATERERLEEERRRAAAASAAAAAKAAERKRSDETYRTLVIVGTVLVAAGFFISVRSSGNRSETLPSEAFVETPAEAVPLEDVVSSAGEARDVESAPPSAADEPNSRGEDASSNIQDPVIIPATPSGSAWLGVVLSNLEDAAAQALGLPGAMGVLVNQVVSGGPAQAAGLRPGDVLLVINGEFIDAMPDVVGELQQLQPGTTIEFRVVRDQKELRVNVTLGRAPPPTDRP